MKLKPQHILLGLLFLLLFAQADPRASEPVPFSAPRRNAASLAPWGAFGLVLLETNLTVNLDPSPGKIGSAARGALAGLALTAAAAPPGGNNPLGAMFFLAVGVTHAIAGATAAAVQSTSKKKQAETASALTSAIGNQDFASRLRDAIFSRTSGYLGTNLVEITNPGGDELERTQSYWQRRFTNVLEIDRLEFGLTAQQTFETDVQVFALVHSRLLDLSTEEVIHELTWMPTSLPRPFNYWVESGGSKFVETCRELVARLGEDISDEVFLRALPEPLRGNCLGLDLVQPKMKLTAEWSLAPSDVHAAFVKVKSRQPTLKWKPFEPSSGLGRVEDISYEIRIWSLEEIRTLDNIFYTRTGILAPEHQVETPLPAKGKFLWTVRAHFSRDGRPSVSSWAMIKVNGNRWAGSLEPALLFRFKTP